MRKLLTLLLLTTTSLFAETSHNFSLMYSHLFKNYNACFILYNLNEHKIVQEYNPYNRCNQRIAPDSTFKIPLSLMAFNQELINSNTVFKWDGVKREFADWNHDQTPKSWLTSSVVWVSQQITAQLGLPRIKNYLSGFHYGNQDFSGDPKANNGLKYAWLSSSLKISAIEQLHFLNAMLSDELPVRKEAIENTKANMYLGKLANGAEYYGKTGSGRNGNNERELNPSKLRDGWFLGYIEQGNKRYIFVSNLTDKSIPTPDKLNGGYIPYGSEVLKPLTLQLLNAYFSAAD